MSYCNGNTLHQTLTHHGSVLSLINDQPNKKNRMRKCSDPLYYSSTVPFYNFSGYDEFRRKKTSAPDPSTDRNEASSALAYLRRSNENEKRVIASAMVGLNKYQTPAEWRMKTVDSTLRRSAGRARTARPSTSDRSEDFLSPEMRTPFENNNRKAPRGNPVPVMRHYNICPDWRSELKKPKEPEQVSNRWVGIIPLGL